MITVHKCFRSKRRCSILKFLAGHNSKFVTLSCISDNTNIPYKDVSRQIILLESRGIVKKQKLGNTVFVSLEVDKLLANVVKLIVSMR